MKNQKRLKKTAAMILAGVLACGTTVWTGTVFTADVKAAGEITSIPEIDLDAAGSLTIHKTDNRTESKPLSDAEFTVYQVMSLGDAGNGTCVYTPQAPFDAVLTENDVTADALGTYSTQEIEALAEKLEAVSKTATAAGTEITGDTGEAKFDDLALGYYLVVETGVPAGYMAGQPFLVAVPSADNYADATAPATSWVYDVVAAPKNYRIGIDKEINRDVEETEDNVVSNDGTVEVGDFVPYKITTRIPDYRDEAYVNDTVVFKITDVMSDGLKIVDMENYPIAVAVEDDAALMLNRDYTVTANEAAAGTEPDLTITFASDYLKSPKAANKEVTVTYYAKVTDKALAGTAGNANKPYLDYTHAPGQHDGKVEGADGVKVYTFDINVVKFAEKDGAKTLLEGARFTLYKGSVDAQNMIGEKETVKGKISFDQLDEGIYYLVETKAPEGYTMLANPIKVEIRANRDAATGLVRDGSFTLKINDKEITAAEVVGDYVSHTDQAKGDSSVAVENHKGFSLPATGGMGIVLFLAMGVTGIVIVSVLLTRKSKDEK